MTKFGKVLVTGAGGMIGSHMVETLYEQGVDVVGSFYKPTIDMSELDSSIALVECDVRYPQSVERIIDESKPSAIFHLAAQSYPTVSWDRPYETMDINANGTIAVFEAVKKVRKANPEYDPVVVVACSSAEYGATFDELDRAVKEDDPLLPLHPYGVSKVAQDLLAYQYYANDGIRCIRARIFNTTGTRKVGDVCSDFVRRSVGLVKENSDRMVLRVGNIETRRAILDSKDLINALCLLAEKGVYGQAYNICAQHAYPIGNIIDEIQAILGVAFELNVDERLLRPTDERIILGDTTKLKSDTGWRQSVGIEQTLREMCLYWQERI